MKTIYLTKKQDYPAGKMCTVGAGFNILKESTKVIDKDTGKILLIYIKGALNDEKLIEIGKDFRKYTRLHEDQRSLDAKKVDRIYKGIVYKVPPKSSPKVRTGIAGFMTQDAFNMQRMTAPTKKHKEMFFNESVKVCQKVSQLYKKYAPKEYAKQLAFIKKINPNVVIPGTVFTTVTINEDYRTGSHRDKNDYDGGLGNLTVLGKSFTHGETLFPEYKCGVAMKEGDVMLMNVHEMHCNAPINGKGRLALVMYAREGFLREKHVSIKVLEGITSKAHLNIKAGRLGIRKQKQAAQAAQAARAA